MRLTTTPGPTFNSLSKRRRAWALVVIAAGIAVTFTLDCLTTTARVQHLYYLPIIISARTFGKAGALLSAATAIVLYHVANRPLLAFRYGETDVVHMAVFLAVGLVTAKMSSDAQRMHQLAMTDDLTGLHNLRSFEALLAAFIATARADHSSLALLVLDVDRLKALNDSHGHLAGADAVRTVGHVLAERLPPRAVACRYGGDEFVIAVPNCDAFQAEQIGNDVRSAVNAAAPLLAGVEWPAGTLSISVGVTAAVFDDAQTGVDDGEHLLRTADRALYLAKGGGRNRVCAAVMGSSPSSC